MSIPLQPIGLLKETTCPNCRHDYYLHISFLGPKVDYTISKQELDVLKQDVIAMLEASAAPDEVKKTMRVIFEKPDFVVTPESKRQIIEDFENTYGTKAK